MSEEKSEQEKDKYRNIVEAGLLAAGQPMTVDQLQGLFDEFSRPEKRDIEEALARLDEDYSGRGIELVKVASGYRIQVHASMQPWISRLWVEKPGRYSRAFLETLAIIAYRQPVTRGEIEDIRGVSVSSNIVKTLMERGWVRVVGHRDVPGKPAMFGTTREFLDYFNLRRLDDLPSLMELRDLSEINPELDLPLGDEHQIVIPPSSYEEAFEDQSHEASEIIQSGQDSISPSVQPESDINKEGQIQ